MYGFLADVLVGIHVLYIGFVLGGLLLILLGMLLRWEWIRNPWFRGIHLLSILIVAGEAVVGYQCPLTTWEKELRDLAGQPVEGDTFIGRMLHNLILYDDPSDMTRTVLAIADWVVAGLVVATFILAPPRFRRRKAESPAPTLAGSNLPPAPG
jgi:hypothetical protein